jgi:hypothetical protein
MKEKNLLEVKDLRVSFFTPVGEVKAVDGRRRLAGCA